MKNRTYRYMEYPALYPFGYGLSYTKFEYSNLKADPMGEDCQITVDVTNTGEFAGEEVTEVYMKDLESANAVRNHSLCAFKRVHLEPGETKQVSLVIRKKSFEIVDENGERYQESSRFRIFAGGSQPDDRSVALTGQRPLEIEIEKR